MSLDRPLHLSELKKMLVIIPAFPTGLREIIGMKIKRFSNEKSLEKGGIIFMTSEFVPSPGQSSENHF